MRVDWPSYLAYRVQETPSFPRCVDMLWKKSRTSSASAFSYGPAILSTAAARCTPCYRRNTSRGAALLEEEEAVRVQNCTGRADLKQGRVLVGLRGAALIRCHYAEWDRCYCVRVHIASFREVQSATPKKSSYRQGVTNES